jgi:hypothetical protein
VLAFFSKLSPLREQFSSPCSASFGSLDPWCQVLLSGASVEVTFPLSGTPRCVRGRPASVLKWEEIQRANSARDLFQTGSATGVNVEVRKGDE